MFVRSLKFLAIIIIIVSNLTAKDISIDKLIQEIKHSKGDIKRQKINKLKLMLRDANAKTRNLAIYKLQQSQHKAYQNHTSNIKTNVSTNTNHITKTPTTHITNTNSLPHTIQHPISGTNTHPTFNPTHTHFQGGRH
jgi:hypothetical protein